MFTICEDIFVLNKTKNQLIFKNSAIATYSGTGLISNIKSTQLRVLLVNISRLIVQAA